MSETYNIQESQDRFSVTIPASLARAKGLEKGTEVKWKVNDQGELILKKSN